MINIKEKVDRKTWKPIQVKNDKRFLSTVKKLESKYPGLQIVDQYEINLEELFLLRNPRYRFNPEYAGDFSGFLKKHYKGEPKYNAGVWFLYPWNRTLVHFLPDKMHQELRTGRNRYLITEEEQYKFYEARVGILGMSVGSHVAVMIAVTGGAKHIKLADPDTLSGDNLNRIRGGFYQVGLPKALAVARQIYELNPFAKVETYLDGLTKENMNSFLGSGDNKLDVLIEEMDNPYLKIKVRELARPKGIPVIMAADNGDNIIVDVERYDLNKKLPILHGILGDMTSVDFKKVHPMDLPRTIAKMAGANIATIRMLESVTKVGKTIYSWPQLGTAANLCGSVLAYLARELVLKTKIKSGRYPVNIDTLFNPMFSDKHQLTNMNKKRGDILKMIGL
ncbi:MAG: ThiF family adenylyltransferase [Anaplasmataceae bacterium]|nr:ThiF family adenylyltransferase [Anaplasmataceae bacterium]